LQRRLDFVENLIVQTASYPPLQKTQGRGTHIAVVSARSKAKPVLEGWATRPVIQFFRSLLSHFSSGFCERGMGYLSPQPHEEKDFSGSV
jgi:hypothetical protein